MNVNHTEESEQLRPLHIVMMVLLVAIVGGSCLLLSAPQSAQLMEGAIEWHEGSLLRAVVQVLCLNYQAPTLHAGTVKNYILGMGAGLSIIIFVIAIVVRSQGESYKDETGPHGSTTDSTTGPLTNNHSDVRISLLQRLASPLITAQMLIAFYALWSFVSSRWSSCRFRY